MVYAVHHVAGRLRIRNPGIKGSARDTARYCDVVRCLPGVYAVKGRAITGSVIIEYDPCVVRPQVLLGLLGAQAPVNKGVAEKVAEKVGQALMERLIERSASVLIAALI
jgi:hypothetical protein